ncbi:MAG: zincin-like metallopeptidase domain-containing protein [Verrucomicrobiota bacterium]
MLLARGYNVFNAAQVDGYQPPDTPQLSDNARNDRAEQFFVAQEADIQHGGSAAFYDVDRDLIILPDYRNFRSVGGYYATLAHEMTHWTGEPRRLNRNLGNRFGSASYAMEELIAELGAAFICARLQLTPEVRDRPCRLHRHLARRAETRCQSRVHGGRQSATGRRLAQ